MSSVAFEDVMSSIAGLARPLQPAETVLGRFRSRLRRQTVSKGTHLCRAGDMVDTLYFVAGGIVRYYYLAGGVEHTGQFFTAGMFCGDVKALTTGTEALQNFDVLADCALVVIPMSALQEAYDKDHAFERFGRRMMEMVVAGSQRRSANLLMRSAEERYADLARSRPEILKGVPQYVVASYLGITPESLSRIRARRL